MQRDTSLIHSFILWLNTGHCIIKHMHAINGGSTLWVVSLRGIGLVSTHHSDLLWWSKSCLMVDCVFCTVTSLIVSIGWFLIRARWVWSISSNDWHFPSLHCKKRLSLSFTRHNQGFDHHLSSHYQRWYVITTSKTDTKLLEFILNDLVMDKFSRAFVFEFWLLVFYPSNYLDAP